MRILALQWNIIISPERKQISVPVAFVAVLGKFQPSNLRASSVEYRAVCGSIFARGQLSRLLFSLNINDINLHNISILSLTYMSNTYILFGMPRFWQLGILYGVNDICGRNIEVVCTTERFNRGVLYRYLAKNIWPQ